MSDWWRGQGACPPVLTTEILTMKISDGDHYSEKELANHHFIKWWQTIFIKIFRSTSILCPVTKTVGRWCYLSDWGHHPKGCNVQKIKKFNQVQNNSQWRTSGGCCDSLVLWRKKIFATLYWARNWIVIATPYSSFHSSTQGQLCLPWTRLVILNINYILIFCQQKVAEKLKLANLWNKQVARQQLNFIF